MCTTAAYTSAHNISIFIVSAVFFTTLALSSRTDNSGSQFEYWINDGTELIELWGNNETFLKLQCQSIKKQIAVIEAFLTCGDIQKQNIRQAINKRCSGKNLCSFILAKDCPDAFQWGNGTFYVQYACIPERDVIKTCSANVTVYLNEEGFIQTPGYPRYYVGGRPCRWTLRAQQPNIQIQLRFMDIALRGIGPLEQQCRDWLTVNEHGLDVLATCGDLTEDITIKSTGPEINISLTTASINLFPKRGLFIHFQGVGGETQKINCEGPLPSGAHLVMNNDTHVQYRCIEGYVFAETASRDLIISCRYHIHTEARCVLDKRYMNMTLDSIVVGGDVDDETGDMYSDIVVPSIVLALLIIGNAVIIGIVHLHRKRLTAGGEDSWVQEELVKQRAHE